MKWAARRILAGLRIYIRLRIILVIVGNYRIEFNDSPKNDIRQHIYTFSKQNVKNSDSDFQFCILYIF